MANPSAKPDDVASPAPPQASGEPDAMATKPAVPDAATAPPPDQSVPPQSGPREPGPFSQRVAGLMKRARDAGGDRRLRRLAVNRGHLRALVFFTALFDVGVVVAGFAIAYQIVAALFAPRDLEFLGIAWPRTFVVGIALMTWYAMQSVGAYREHVLKLGLQQVMLALRANAVVHAFLFFACWIDRGPRWSDEGYFEPRLYAVTLAAVISSLGLILLRGIAVRALLGTGHWRRRAILVGSGEEARFLTRRLRQLAHAGYTIVGRVDEPPAAPTVEAVSEASTTPAPSDDADGDGLPPRLGSIDDLTDLAEEHDLDEAFLAMAGSAHERLLDALAACKRARLTVRVLSDLWGVLLEKVSVDAIAGVPLVAVRDTPLVGLNAAFKRAVDLAGSAALLLAASPVLLAITLAVRLSSPGPILFAQTRVGRNGREFRFYKFRSMVVDNDATVHREFVQAMIRGEEVGETDGNTTGKVTRKLTADDRVTGVGRFIRRWSIDELPQLLNVLKGDMSLVGPRPPLPYEVDAYDEWHKRRLDVRPGLTGLWQTVGRSEVTFEEMVILDLYYIENWSHWLDLRILLATVPAVLRRRGAH